MCSAGSVEIYISSGSCVVLYHNSMLLSRFIYLLDLGNYLLRPHIVVLADNRHPKAVCVAVLLNGDIVVDCRSIRYFDGKPS